MNITKFLNNVYFTPRLKEIAQYTDHAGELQQKVLQRLVTMAADTEWGRKYDYSSIHSYEDFRKRLPIQTYDEIKPYVTRLRAGEQNLLWPSEIRWFAKSSGTTNDKSKFLPVSRESLHDTHYRGGQGCRSHLPGTEPRKPVLFGQRPHPGRQPQPQPQLQPQPRGRPFGHPYPKCASAGELHPCTQQEDCPDG